MRSHFGGYVLRPDGIGHGIDLHCTPSRRRNQAWRQSTKSYMHFTRMGYLENQHAQTQQQIPRYAIIAHAHSLILHFRQRSIVDTAITRNTILLSSQIAFQRPHTTQPLKPSTPKNPSHHPTYPTASFSPPSPPYHAATSHPHPLQPHHPR